MKKLTNLLFITALILTSWQGFSQKNLTPTTPPEGVKLATAEDVIKVKNSGGIIYDIRWHYSEYEFEGHIPGAVSVPFTEWSALSMEYNAYEDTWDFSKLPADKNTPVLFYCMGDGCWKSPKLAEQVALKGYKNVYWYRGGQPDWDKQQMTVNNKNVSYIPLMNLYKGANNPTTWFVEPATVKQWYDNKEKFQVIDIRYISHFEEGRLKDAYQVALADLLSRDGIQLMPKPQENYKILLVSENGQTASAAAVSLALLGYNVKVLNGGWDAWKAQMKDQYTEKGKLKVNAPGGSGWKGQVFKLPKGTK